MAHNGPATTVSNKTFAATEFSLADFYVGNTDDPRRPPSDFATFLRRGDMAVGDERSRLSLMDGA
jgi:hypothetical protein